MDDGGDYSAQGQLPYGTLLFNVLENGQPRWQALPTQVVDEGSMGTLSLLPFLSDTDDEGNSAPASALSLEIISTSNTDVFDVYLDLTNIVFETVNDVNGGYRTIVRDGEQLAKTGRKVFRPTTHRLDLTSGDNLKLGTAVINLRLLTMSMTHPTRHYYRLLI